MRRMKVAINDGLTRFIETQRETVSLAEADLTEVSAVVLDDSEAEKWGCVVRQIRNSDFCCAFAGYAASGQCTRTCARHF